MSIYESAYRMETQYLMDNYVPLNSTCKDPLLELFRNLVTMTGHVTEQGLFSEVLNKQDCLSDTWKSKLDSMTKSVRTEPYLYSGNISLFIESVYEAETRATVRDLEVTFFLEKTIINHGAFAITDVVEFISMYREYDLSGRKNKS